MMKLAYQLGCSTALAKLGMSEGDQFMQALADRFRAGGHTSANTRAFVNLNTLSPAQREAILPFLYPGRHETMAEAMRVKRGGLMAMFAQQGAKKKRPPLPPGLEQLARPQMGTLSMLPGLAKRSGYRVPVTDDQTPQTEMLHQATDAALQKRNVDDLWEQHDKRQKEFVEPGWNY